MQARARSSSGWQAASSLGPGDLHLQVERLALAEHETAQMDVVRVFRRQGQLHRLGGAFEQPGGRRIDRDAGMPDAELLRDQVPQDLIEILASKLWVAKAGFHIQHAENHLQHGDIQRAAAEVEHHDLLVRIDVLHAESQGRRGRLVDQPGDVQPGELACVKGGPPCGIGEVRGHGEHHVAHGLAERRLGLLPKLAEDHGGNFFRTVVLLAQPNRLAAAHQAFDFAHSAARQIDPRPRFLADHELAVIVEGHQRGHDRAATGRRGIGNRPAPVRAAALRLEHANLRRGRAQVDPDGVLLRHGVALSGAGHCANR